MTTSDTMTLTVLTPEKMLLETAVSKVSLPASKGRFMVLRNHAPVISSLTEGDIVYTSDDNEGRIHILTGFVEVNDNRITVCAEV
jgi:F-type H+-transporting ATPase subunit epsilon